MSVAEDEAISQDAAISKDISPARDKDAAVSRVISSEGAPASMPLFLRWVLWPPPAHGSARSDRRETGQRSARDFVIFTLFILAKVLVNVKKDQ